MAGNRRWRAVTDDQGSVVVRGRSVLTQMQLANERTMRRRGAAPGALAAMAAGLGFALAAGFLAMVITAPTLGIWALAAGLATVTVLIVLLQVVPMRATERVAGRQGTVVAELVGLVNQPQTPRTVPLMRWATPSSRPAWTLRC